MKRANLAAQLAAAETELTCLKLALAKVKEDCDELRQERDDWRREAEMLCAEKLIAAKLREADERRFAPPERPPIMVAPPRERLGRNRPGQQADDQQDNNDERQAYLRSIALVLLSACNRNEPALAPRHPQLIGGSEVCRRIIERADSNLKFIGAIYGRKHRRPAYGTEMTIIGR
jgi:hypothetical protein